MCVLKEDLLPALRVEKARGGITGSGNFQKARTAPNGEQLAACRCTFGEEALKRSDRLIADDELNAVRDSFISQFAARQVRHAITETIYVDN